MENYSTLSRDKTFRRRSYGMIIFGVIAIAGLYVVVFMVQNYFAGTTPTGESGSSYGTVSNGTRAWSELLSSYGYEVTKDRGSATLPNLDNSDIDTYDMLSSNLTLSRKTQTVILLGGALPENETNELRTFIKYGGRVITDNPLVLNDLLGHDISISVQGDTRLTANDDVSGMDGIKDVVGSGVGSIAFKPTQYAQPLLTSSQDRPTDIDVGSNDAVANAAIFRVGLGDVVALVDTGVVSNQALPEKDNALFSLRIVGSEGSGATFIEGVHGYDNARGFAGMPMSWRIAIIGLFVALVIFGCAQGRRFGVGEEPNRDLGPRRIFYAYAIAQALKKSKR